MRTHNLTKPNLTKVPKVCGIRGYLFHGAQY